MWRCLCKVACFSKLVSDCLLFYMNAAVKLSFVCNEQQVNFTSNEKFLHRVKNKETRLSVNDLFQ